MLLPFWFLLMCSSRMLVRFSSIDIVIFSLEGLFYYQINEGMSNEGSKRELTDQGLFDFL